MRNQGDSGFETIINLLDTLTNSMPWKGAGFVTSSPLPSSDTEPLPISEIF
ncbi:MAG: hypothetical protein WBF90_21165 [Rivularia sp. (in: cyanobacteria)]